MLIYKQETSDRYMRSKRNQGFNWEFPPPSMLSAPQHFKRCHNHQFPTNSIFYFFYSFDEKYFKNCFQRHVAEGVDWAHQKVKREYYFLHCFWINHPPPPNFYMCSPLLGYSIFYQSFYSAHIFIFSHQPRLCRAAFNVFPFSLLRTCPAKL